MNFVSCYNPKVITNRYTGERVTCSCGKCNACLNTRAANWVRRLDMEADCHKYVLFTTLTYDDFQVNQIVRLRKEDYNGLAYIDSENGEVLDMSEINSNFSKKDVEYCYETKVLDVLQKRDFQGFIKRLRSHFDYCSKGAKLRYFLCGEYGPTTYRPHGHLLLFFDDPKCASEIEVLLSKSWSYGVIYDPHFVHGSASKYVAGYLNSVTRLPKCYLHKSIRPFTLFSKNPAIGTLYPNISDVKNLFETGQTDFVRLDKSKSVFVHEPLLQCVETRLYPRCPRFGLLSDNDRIKLYGKILEFPYWLTAKEIANRIKWEYIDSGRQDFFGRYFRVIAFKPVVKPRLRVTNVEDPFVGLPIALRPLNAFVDKEFDFIHEHKTEFCFDSLVRFARVVSRVRHQAEIFGVSIPYYVSKISAYYAKKDKLRQQKDYDFQDDFFKSAPPYYHIYFDFDFYRKVTTTDYSTWSDDTVKSLSYMFNGSIPFKIKDGLKVLNIPDYRFLTQYRHFKSLHDKIAHDSVKTKKSNSDSFMDKDKFGNIIRYNNV